PHQIAAAKWPSGREDLPCPKAGGRAGRDGQTAHAIEDAAALRWELSSITQNRCQLGLQLRSDVYGNLTIVLRRSQGFETELKIELAVDCVDWQPFKVLIPFGQPRIKHSRIGDQHGL